MCVLYTAGGQMVPWEQLIIRGRAFLQVAAPSTHTPQSFAVDSLTKSLNLSLTWP